LAGTAPTLIPEISVIIPTYNRIAVLGLTLQALAHQSMPTGCFEVILVDDGSQEDLEEMIASLGLEYSLRVLRQEHRGPGAVRNLGAMHAQAGVLLFLDSDMIGVPELLACHLESQREQPERLVVGPRSPYVGSNALDPLTVFDYGQDGRDGRLEKTGLTYQEIFTCNLSMSMAVWRKLGGFREDMLSYEDVEFAYQAAQRGVAFAWNTAALAYHNHPMGMTARCRKAALYSCSAALLYRLHPELRGQIAHLRDKEPIRWSQDSPGLILRKLARSTLAAPPVLWLMRQVFDRLPGQRRTWLQRFLYWKIIGSYQWIGLREGIAQHGWEHAGDNKMSALGDR
jgi:GT2 family glycosyltransferase